MLKPVGSLRFVVVALAMVGACSPAKSALRGSKSPGGGKEVTSRIVACKLITVEEMSALTGQTFTQVEAVDDPTQASSKCLYSAPNSPTGASLDIQWIRPSDYSSEAEHLAMQQASIGGARLGGKLTAGMVPAGGGMPSGAVEGVGDEATIAMGLLTARKGDVTIMLQIMPADMMAFVSNPKVSAALMETEKTVMIKALSRLP